MDCPSFTRPAQFTGQPGPHTVRLGNITASQTWEAQRELGPNPPTHRSSSSRTNDGVPHLPADPAAANPQPAHGNTSERSGRAERESLRGTQGFEHRYRRVLMAEGSKPDVPLFQLLSDLLQQVRSCASTVLICQSTNFADFRENCRAAALISPPRSVAVFRRPTVFVSWI